MVIDDLYMGLQQSMCNLSTMENHEYLVPAYVPGCDRGINRGLRVFKVS